MSVNVVFKHTISSIVYQTNESEAAMVEVGQVNPESPPHSAYF
jgi:hypothetical protein